MRRIAAVLAVTAALVLLPVSGEAQSIGVGLRAGTLGLGGEVAVGLTRTLGIRAGVGAFPFTYTGMFSNVQYHVHPPATLSNVGIDVFPWGGAFHLSAGALLKPQDIVMTAIYSGSVTLGGTTYSGSQVGVLTGHAGYSSIAPYAALGWGRISGHGLGLFVDVGAAFLNAPTIRLSATGPIASDPAFQTSLALEQQQAQTHAATYMKVLPIISLGLHYGFGLK